MEISYDNFASEKQHLWMPRLIRAPRMQPTSIHHFVNCTYWRPWMLIGRGKLLKCIYLGRQRAREVSVQHAAPPCALLWLFYCSWLIRARTSPYRRELHLHKKSEWSTKERIKAGRADWRLIIATRTDAMAKLPVHKTNRRNWAAQSWLELLRGFICREALLIDEIIRKLIEVKKI